MTQDPQTIAWLDQEDARLAQIDPHPPLRRSVRRGRATSPTSPAFGYTVGLFGLGHPELVVTGLDHRTSHALLNRVAGMVVDGRDLVPGEVLQDDTGRDIAHRRGAAQPRRRPASRANRFYERPDEFSVPAFQLTWADADGGFPWDPLLRVRRRTASPGRGRGGRDAGAQPRPSSRRSLATWPVALTL